MLFKILLEFQNKCTNYCVKIGRFPSLFRSVIFTETNSFQRFMGNCLKIFEVRLSAKSDDYIITRNLTVFWIDNCINQRIIEEHFFQKFYLHEKQAKENRINQIFSKARARIRGLARMLFLNEGKETY